MKTSILAGAGVVGMWASCAAAAPVQIGDFRINAAAVSTETPYNTFSFTTRGVTGAPVNIYSTFSGVSQNNDSTTDTNDVELKTFSSVTNVYTLSRYATPEISGGGPATAGAVQWSFNLAPLATYLSANNLSLGDIEFTLSTTDPSLPYDLYLSYTDPSQDMSLVGISSSQNTNYSTLFVPGHNAAVGSAVNGQFVVLGENITSSSASVTNDITDDLTSLYDDGVDQFNLIMVAGSYGLGDTISVASSSSTGLPSGIYITTTPAVPEPASVALLGGCGLLALRRRRV